MIFDLKNLIIGQQYIVEHNWNDTLWEKKEIDSIQYMYNAVYVSYGLFKMYYQPVLYGGLKPIEEFYFLIDLNIPNEVTVASIEPLHSSFKFIPKHTVFYRCTQEDIKFIQTWYKIWRYKRHILLCFPKDLANIIVGYTL